MSRLLKRSYVCATVLGIILHEHIWSKELGPGNTSGWPPVWCPAQFLTIMLSADPSPGSPVTAGSPPSPPRGEGIVKSYVGQDTRFVVTTIWPRIPTTLRRKYVPALSPAPADPVPSWRRGDS
jgi:hypothetical protein